MAIALALSPLLVVGVGALLLMLAEAFSKHAARRASALGAAARSSSPAAAFAGARVALRHRATSTDVASLAPWLIIDRFTLFFDIVLCLGGGLAALLAGGYLPEHNLDRGEFYPLLLFATVGAMMLAAAGDLLTLFLGLETMSHRRVRDDRLPPRVSPRSAEGALKYFLLGSFAAALLLYGFALLYGATGHTDLAGIGAARRHGGAARSPLAHRRRGARPRRARLQGERGAVPHVDARRVRRRAHAGDDVHGRRREERRRSRCCCACSLHGVRRRGVDVVGERAGRRSSLRSRCSR